MISEACESIGPTSTQTSTDSLGVQVEQSDDSRAFACRSEQAYPSTRINTAFPCNPQRSRYI